MREVFPGVFEHAGKILTVNSVPGKRVYGEELITVGKKEYRVWDPYRSKLAAAIKNGLKTWFFSENSRVLYLGAAEGTTASHVADVVREGIVFCVDVAPRVMAKLVDVCSERKNMLPILADAGKPGEYGEYVREVGGVDVIYEDVAHPDQTEFLIRNALEFMPKGGAYLCIKARSIDVTKDPKEVYREEEKKLEEYFEIVERVNLEPYEKDHIMLVLKR